MKDKIEEELKFANDYLTAMNEAKPSGRPDNENVRGHLNRISELLNNLPPTNKEKTIYNLKLHEGLMSDFGICIMRVPGGWLYGCWDTEKNQFKRGTFVPFNNKFKAEE